MYTWYSKKYYHANLLNSYFSFALDILHFSKILIIFWKVKYSHLILIQILDHFLKTSLSLKLKNELIGNKTLFRNQMLTVCFWIHWIVFKTEDRFD